MISDEERREVARKLRELPSDTYYEELHNRLADLIDRPTTTRHGRFKKRHGREVYCPKCGAVIV